MASADLEISLYRQGDAQLLADAQLTHGDTRAMRAERVPVAIDSVALLAADGDPEAYGHLLSRALFHSDALRSAWDTARGAAHGAGCELRLRLSLRADDMHALCWERLRDPQTDAPLAKSAQVLLSRYLSSGDLTPVRVGPRGDLRALAVAASPRGLRPGMAPVDAAGELRLARDALAPLPIVALGDPDGGPRASRRELLAALSDGCDLLYLACHGTLHSGESYLWLEDEGGAAQRVGGADLAQAIAGLRRRPLLVVLAVCDSAAGPQGEGALVALGARLARAGVPAVVAMQGAAPVRLIEQLMPALFQRLLAHGQIDLALSQARQTLDPGLPWWMPALLLRVADGRLWRPERAREDRAMPDADPDRERAYDPREDRGIDDLQLTGAQPDRAASEMPDSHSRPPSDTSDTLEKLRQMIDGTMLRAPHERKRLFTDINSLVMKAQAIYGDDYAPLLFEEARFSYLKGSHAKVSKLLRNIIESYGQPAKHAISEREIYELRAINYYAVWAKQPLNSSPVDPIKHIRQIAADIGTIHSHHLVHTPLAWLLRHELLDKIDQQQKSAPAAQRQGASGSAARSRSLSDEGLDAASEPDIDAQLRAGSDAYDLRGSAGARGNDDS
ncbi:CHAT domain-containing protein [Oscillochloris sp. ZM17-4]|uniref:CHAT domain-containing protein n=1 Tax=Oscillochloris sp. ZM17-4 TaxID=2866714 RepID=UPI001C72A2FE|nr:CHAT domain-containing protein [Oscillochloris sp. ZM17-4]MBX0327163.1 CHAT domain-containing protein [Oscillochloris sp. ZM17-4]